MALIVSNSGTIPDTGEEGPAPGRLIHASAGGGGASRSASTGTPVRHVDQILAYLVLYYGVSDAPQLTGVSTR